MNKYIFVVDTNSYAGNFERELTAHCTGQIGDCEVGQDLARIFQDRFPVQCDAFSDIIAHRAEENGCRRPASSWSTIGYWNDGMGSVWPDAKWGSDEAVAAYRSAIAAYRQKHPESLRHIDDPATAMPNRCSAHCSVAIFFDDLPGDELIALMVERARCFAPKWSEGSFTILGFRLLQETTTLATVWSKVNDVA